MKKRNLYIKRIFQIILYFIEVFGIAVALTIIVNKFIPVNNWFVNIERTTVFYTLYQIIIYNVLKQLNDIKKDQYLAILTMYKYIKIYNSSKSDNLKENICNLISKQLDTGMLNDIDIRNEYNEIKSVLDGKGLFDEEMIDLKIVRYEHLCEYANLNWRYSILLRIFK